MKRLTVSFQSTKSRWLETKTHYKIFRVFKGGKISSKFQQEEKMGNVIMQALRWLDTGNGN